MLNRNDPCWCNSGKKWKKCHYPIGTVRNAQDLAREYKKKFGILLKTPEEIKGIKHACKVATRILDKLCHAAKAGATTNELDLLAIRLHKEANATAAPLGYGDPPFPKSICTSLNEVVCHGIPNDIPLKEGDILNIDVTSIVDGYYGDCSRMVAIGKIDEEKKRVMDVSYECLMKAIEILKPGVLVCEIGKVIEELAAVHKCSVVNIFVGHGVGLQFHEPPQIPHHLNRIDVPLVEGMTFTIEPMINAGIRTTIVDSQDHWTARTADEKPSAQWEHTLLITSNGYEILTVL